MVSADNKQTNLYIVSIAEITRPLPYHIHNEQ